MSSKKNHRRKNKLPQGPYRQRWDMPHKRDTDYKRSKNKREAEEIIDDEWFDAPLDPDSVEEIKKDELDKLPEWK